MYGYWARHYWQVSYYILMAEPLFEAIFNRYLASTLKDSLTALYNTEAPANAVYPYGVFALPSDAPDSFASNKMFVENCLLQFNLYDNEPLVTRLLQAYTALKAAFDFAPLAVTDYTTLSCVREGTVRSKVEKIWQFNVIYRVKLKVT